MIFPTHKVIETKSVRSYANNARTHSDDQIAQLAASITAFGFTNPVLIDEENELIAGHGRLAAAERLGFDQVPAIVVEGLTRAQKAALRLADNRLALSAGWDDDMLRTELADLRDSDVDPLLTGFGAAEIDQLFAPDLDPAGEWQGMPEFEQADQRPHQTVAVHFLDQGAVDAFAALIGQPLTSKTRFVWFPRQERRSPDEAYGSTVSYLHSV